MIRIILGVIVGFVAWSIVWVGSDQVLQSASPFFAAYARAGEYAMVNNSEFIPDWRFALVQLLRSFPTSIIAGFLTALVAGENRRSTLILGIVLVLVGAAVEVFAWKLSPAWYHILFLIGLIPMTVLGGKLRRAVRGA